MVAEGEVVEEVAVAEGEVVAEVAEGAHRQIGHTIIWDHFHRGTGIPSLHG